MIDINMLFKFNRESGQVGVIILLTMTGMLVMGLSVASRTTQEALLSGKEVESTRVFNAAEQGIEKALSGDLDFIGDTYEGTVESVVGIGVDFTIAKINMLETRLFEGVSVGVDVTGASDGDNLQIDWSKLTDCGAETLASIIVSIYYDDSGTTRVRHEALGACNIGDGFTLGSVIDENGYKRRFDLPLQTDDFLVRVKAVYNDVHIKVSSSDFAMPVQYYAIRSKNYPISMFNGYYAIRSEAANEESSETRIVEVNRTLKSAPSILDYAVYSGGSLSK